MIGSSRESGVSRWMVAVVGVVTCSGRARRSVGRDRDGGVVDRGRGDPGGRAGGRARDGVQRLAEGAPVPRTAEPHRARAPLRDCPRRRARSHPGRRPRRRRHLPHQVR